MTEKVDVRFGLAFVQLINVVSGYIMDNKNCVSLPDLKKKKSQNDHFLFIIFVYIYFYLFQNEKNQIMKSNVWLRLVSNISF